MTEPDSPGGGGAYDAYNLAACALLTTRHDGTIEQANATACAWTGYAREELVGKRFQDLLTVGSKLFHYTQWMPLLQMQGSVAEVQLEMVRRDGRVLPVLVNAARRGSEGSVAPGVRPPVDIAVFIASDRRKYERELLAARKRAEELLEREREAQEARSVAEARLRLALDSARLRVWTADVTTGARAYEPGTGALLGRGDGSEISAELYAAAIHEEDRAAEQAAYGAAIDPARRDGYAVEYRLRGGDGVERIVRSTGRAFFDGDRPLHFSGVLEDVTDRRRAEEALRLRENQFRSLAENSPDVIVRFDRARHLVYLSPVAERFVGKSVAELVGKSLDALDLPPENLVAWSAGLDAAFEGTNAEITLRRTMPDGDEREFHAHLVPERDAHGEIVTVLGIARDVTALRAQEREAQQRAVLAEQLIGIVSHDLRNPLNAVVLGTHLLRTSDLGPNQRVVDRIASAADRANRLIADLLDFTQARLGGGLRVAARDTDLHGLMADTLDEIRLAWPGRKVEQRRVGEGLGSADPDRVAQLATNLVNNALTYGTKEAPVTVTSVVTDDTIELHVHNDGPAIPEALQTQIFEPMRRGEHQLKSGSRSVGLGLYIVREIAVAHRGRVMVRSTAGEGTTFVVRLPRSADRATPAP